MKKVLITGGGGYIGTTMVPYFLDKGWSVRVVDKFFFGQDLLKQHKNLEIVVCDTRNLSNEHFSDIDVVIDMASISNDPSGELFQEMTWEVNWKARAKCAKLAKAAGVARYILTSSCSLYGFQDADTVADETFKPNPLTTYAKANEKAEKDVLYVADEEFTVTVLRLSTVFGYSPRMRFDLAINGMTYGAWKTHKLPLMRDGEQWRPLVHVRDVCKAHCFIANFDCNAINQEIFNVGSIENVCQIKRLGQDVAQTVGNITGHDINVEWYGDPDHRSYRVEFKKIEDLGYKVDYSIVDGVAEICKCLENGTLEKTEKTITLDWYQKIQAELVL